MSLLTSLSFADCDAPELAFEKIRGSTSGFTVKQLWEIPEDPQKQNHDTEIHFGDHRFLFVPDSKTAMKPRKVTVDVTTSKKITSAFKSGEHYLDGIKQKFRLISMEGFDVNGDSKADIILFEVSPGGNAYVGAVGVTAKGLVTMVTPSCF